MVNIAMSRRIKKSRIVNENKLKKKMRNIFSLQVFYFSAILDYNFV